MNRTLTTLTIAAVLALTGCASTATTSETPAQQLHDIDTAAGHASPAAAYTAAFATLSKDCTEQGTPLANEVEATLGLLQKAKVTGETNLTVMQHLAQSIPAGSPKMSCANVAGAYVTLREGQ